MCLMAASHPKVTAETVRSTSCRFAVLIFSRSGERAFVVEANPGKTPATVRTNGNNRRQAKQKLQIVQCDAAR
jgi:hypothetical protein